MLKPEVRRGVKQKASGNVLPANEADRPNCTESTCESMAALTAKLDVIMKRLDKLDVLYQLASRGAA